MLIILQSNKTSVSYLTSNPLYHKNILQEYFTTASHSRNGCAVLLKFVFINIKILKTSSITIGKALDAAS